MSSGAVVGVPGVTGPPRCAPNWLLYNSPSRVIAGEVKAKLAPDAFEGVSRNFVDKTVDCRARLLCSAGRAGDGGTDLADIA